RHSRVGDFRRRGPPVGLVLGSVVRGRSERTTRNASRYRPLAHVRSAGDDEHDAPGLRCVVLKFRDRFGDRIVDNLSPRPAGRVARRFYRDAKPHQDAFRETLAAIALGREDHLLEVGSGGGTFLAWALAAGCTAKAVDHSTDMLALASRRNASAIATG